MKGQSVGLGGGGVSYADTAASGTNTADNMDYLPQHHHDNNNPITNTTTTTTTTLGEEKKDEYVGLPLTDVEEGIELSPSTTTAVQTANGTTAKKKTHNKAITEEEEEEEGTNTNDNNITNFLHFSPSQEQDNDINDNDDEERQALLLSLLTTRVPAEFQIALRLGLAAVEFGSISYKAESFMVRLLRERFGYLATVWVSNGSLTLSIFSSHHNNNNNTNATANNNNPTMPTTDAVAQNRKDGNNNNPHAGGPLAAGIIRATIHPKKENHQNATAHANPIVGTNNGLTNSHNAIPVEKQQRKQQQQQQPLSPPQQLLPQQQPIVPPAASTVRLPWMVTLPFSAGTDCQKLIDLSSICADLLNDVMDVDQASLALEELHTKDPHWNSWQKSLAYIVTSAGFVAILRGNDTDLWIGLLGGALTRVTVKLFDRYWPNKSATFGKWAAAFGPAVLATSISLTTLHCNVSIVIIGSCISEMPGFMITTGTAELVHNCILAGLGNWISAFLICVWLAFGGACGYYGVLAVAGKDYEDYKYWTSGGNPIDELWFILIAPVLALCFSIFFAVGRSELPQSIVVCLVGFGMSLTIDKFPDPNLGNVMAAFVTTVAAQIWARSWHHKLRYGLDHEAVPNPSSVVLLPAFFILVGGSIGVRAFASLVAGDVDEGGSTLLQFLLVPFELVLGMYLGMSLIPSTSVL